MTTRIVPHEAKDLIDKLGLEPHPEGGFYRETFRDPSTDANGRARSTAIYFMLLEGQVSRWHKVDAVETWHWYAGSPLELGLAAPGHPAERVILGFNPVSGILQQARSLGPWTLVGCTVAPGFTFDGFVLAPAGLEPPLS
jgi:predicted cupin superfamily sugar epimerase